MRFPLSFVSFAVLALSSPLQVQQPVTHPNTFATSNDVGAAQAGQTHYDAGRGAYTLLGGGDDVWGSADAFRFNWTRAVGDVRLAADVQVTAPGTHPKAKGMLMVRQSLDPGSPYADVALHADGHMTLQYRLVAGGETKDTDLPGTGPARIEISRTGDTYTAAVLGEKGDAPRSATVSLQVHGPVYVGLGVCSHSTSALESVTFSNVRLTTSAEPATVNP